MTSSDSPDIVLCGGVRTPFARAFGRLADLTADDLARSVLSECLARSGADPAALDEVIVGCAGPPVEAMNMARVAALRAGIPEHVPAVTVHRNCASGIEAVAAARLRLLAGEARLVLAAGAESMSQAPFKLGRTGQKKLLKLGTARGLAAKARVALGLRPKDLIPHPTLKPALTDPYTGLLMGDTAEVLAREFGIDRAAQDVYAAESQRLAGVARREGRLAEEIMPVFVGEAGKLVDDDDGIRDDATVERLARLKPVFDRRAGTVTVGNACQLTDGAAALLVATSDEARRFDLPVLGRVVDLISVGCSPRRMGLGPAIAIPKLLERAGLRADQIALWEINEAFAVQVLACCKSLGDDAPPRDRLNVNGGAIALGHPVGATGIRILLTLLLELRRKNARYGIASLCVGGGQGSAVLVENPDATEAGNGADTKGQRS